MGVVYSCIVCFGLYICEIMETKIIKRKDLTARQFQYLKDLKDGGVIRDLHVLKKFELLGFIELSLATGKFIQTAIGVRGVAWTVDEVKQSFHVEYVGEFYGHYGMWGNGCPYVRKSSSTTLGAMLRDCTRAVYRTCSQYTVKGDALYTQAPDGSDVMLAKYMEWMEEIVYTYTDSAGNKQVVPPRLIKETRDKTRTATPVAGFKVLNAPVDDSNVGKAVYEINKHFKQEGKRYEDITSEPEENYTMYHVPFTSLYNYSFDEMDELRTYLRKVLRKGKEE
jgi:hypothetical protein